MPITSMHRSQHGLTLLELLVAIALLALIASLSWRGLHELHRSSTQLDGEARRWQDLAALFQRLDSDLQQVALRPVRFGAASPGLPPLPEHAYATQTLSAAIRGAMDSSRLPSLQGQDLTMPHTDDNRPDAALEFTRKSTPGQAEVRLGYRLRGQQLELLIWPVLDRAPDTRPQIHVLLDSVSHLRFHYLDAQGVWQEHWPASLVPGQAGVPAVDALMLPHAVKMALRLNDGLELERIFALPY